MKSDLVIKKMISAEEGKYNIGLMLGSDGWFIVRDTWDDIPKKIRKYCIKYNGAFHNKDDYSDNYTRLDYLDGVIQN